MNITAFLPPEKWSCGYLHIPCKTLTLRKPFTVFISEDVSSNVWWPLPRWRAERDNPTTKYHSEETKKGGAADQIFPGSMRIFPGGEPGARRVAYSGGHENKGGEFSLPIFSLLLFLKHRGDTCAIVSLCD
jgi:hypothetical protein